MSKFKSVVLKVNEGFKALKMLCLSITSPHFDLLCSMQVIADQLDGNDLQGLKDMFEMIDADGSGTITYEELRAGLMRIGSPLTESEIRALMDSVWNEMRWMSIVGRSILCRIVLFGTNCHIGGSGSIIHKDHRAGPMQIGSPLIEAGSMEWV